MLNTENAIQKQILSIVKSCTKRNVWRKWKQQLVDMPNRR